MNVLFDDVVVKSHGSIKSSATKTSFLFLQTKKFFKGIGNPADVKYIDPTYMIRACRANASDAILCTVLGQNAVSPCLPVYQGILLSLTKSIVLHLYYFKTDISSICNT